MTSSYTVSETKVGFFNIFIVDSNINIFLLLCTVILIFPPLSDRSLEFIASQFSIPYCSIVSRVSLRWYPTAQTPVCPPVTRWAACLNWSTWSRGRPANVPPPLTQVSAQSVCRLGFHLPIPGRFSKHKDKFYIEWEKMQVMIDKIYCLGRSF